MLFRLVYFMAKENLFLILMFKNLGFKNQKDFLMLVMAIILFLLFMLQTLQELLKLFLKENLLGNIFLQSIIIRNQLKEN
jgi:hypothetical protein